jgi:hypothetical protein
MAKSTITIRIETQTGSLVDLPSLMPLLAPISEILVDILAADGPIIDMTKLYFAERNLPFVTIAGHAVCCTLMCEVTTDEVETRWLLDARRRDLANAFANFVCGTVRPIERLETPAAVGPMFLLACAFETANIVVKHGRTRRVVGAYRFEGRIGSEQTLQS